jgi:hypothetical protein
VSLCGSCNRESGDGVERFDIVAETEEVVRFYPPVEV